MGVDRKATDILLVDWGSKSREGLKNKLQVSGYLPVSADSQESALKFFQEREFSSVVISASADGRGEIKLAKALRAQPTQKQNPTPILFLFDHAVDDKICRESISLGSVDYYVGPVCSELLEFKISTLHELKLLRASAQEDITDQKRTREALQESELQFRNLADSIPNLAWIARGDGIVFWYNQRWYEYTGTDPIGMQGKGWQRVHNPEILPVLLERWNNAIASGQPMEMEYPIRGADGKFRWFLSRVVPVRNSKGEVVRWFGTNTDIDEHRHTREALRQATMNLEAAVEERTAELSQSRAFLDSLIENLPNMVFVKDAKELKFIRFNKAGEDLLGYKRADLIGKNDFDFFPKDQAEFFTSKDRAVLDGHEIVDIAEEKIATLNRGVRILHTKKIPLFDADGKAEYLLGISEDITEVKKAEDERLAMIRGQAALEARELANQRTTFLADASTLLASSLNYHETLEKLAKLSVPALADWCTITMVRDDGSFQRLAAIHKNKSKAHLIEELSRYHPVSTGSSLGIGYVIRTGKSLFTPYVEGTELVGAARNERHLEIMQELGCVSCILVPVIARNKVHGSIALVSGVSGRHFDSQDLALAEELGRRAGIAIDNALLFEASQKAIRTRDEFLSIASHELKTPITSLKLQLQMTRRSVKPDQGILPSAEKIAKVLDVSSIQVNRLTALVEDLLDVSRIQSGKLTYSFEDTDLSALVREMSERFAEQLKVAGCELRIEANQSVMVQCDRFRFEQIIINLLSNAAKYAAGKPVEVCIRRSGDIAQIIVKDYGMGIPAAKLEKIFERFERAVSASNISGLGLGLYITREIVKAHHGVIRAQSKLGEGSTFTVELPALKLKEQLSVQDFRGLQ